MFDYSSAFNRNIGWVTPAEQELLRGKRVAIAGMGGVGGIHLLTLVRLGVGGFNLADFDSFDIANFNRQAGANVASIGRPKLEVMTEQAIGINPELDVRLFPEGVSMQNFDKFLDDVDLFVDGFDFFAIPIRERVFARCAERGIPAITAAPIGMGTGYLAFIPGGMTFEQYFRLEAQSEQEKYLRFLMGVVPRGLHRSYLVDPSRINLKERRGPSTAAACQLCAGVVGTMGLQLLLNRPGIKAAPYHQHFDAYRGLFKTTKLSKGNDTLTQRVRLALARRAIRRASEGAQPSDKQQVSDLGPPHLTRILDAARWAPSGDNSQPWRFEIVSDDKIRIHLTNEVGQNPYDYRNGEPTLLSGGMLLESLRVAASYEGRGLRWTVGYEASHHVITAHFVVDPTIKPSPLASVLMTRSVDRRSYLRRPLRESERRALEAAAGTAFTVTWVQGWKERLRMARLGCLATDIRLRAKETFHVHKAVIDWNSGHSAMAMPAATLGLDSVTLKVMRWAMKSWRRMHTLNQYTGTSFVAAQLDLIPGLNSAAFFMLHPVTAMSDRDRAATLLHRGEAIQRFWLTATRLGLALQPSLAVLIFAHYGAQSVPFSNDSKLSAKARQLVGKFRDVTGCHPEDVCFLGRIGQPRSSLPRIRSSRRPLGELKQESSV